MREFRAHHDAFREHGVFVAAVSRDRAVDNLKWAARLRTPFPLLADEDGAVMRALGIVRPVPLGPWTLEYFRRTTLLADVDGTIAAVWGKVRLRGHAAEVLKVALASQRSSPPRV